MQSHNRNNNSPINNNSLNDNPLNNDFLSSSYFEYVNSSNISMHNMIHLMNQQQSTFSNLLTQQISTPISTPISRSRSSFRSRSNTNYPTTSQTFNREPHRYRANTRAPRLNLNDMINNIFNDFSFNQLFQPSLLPDVIVRPSQEQIEHATQQMLFNTIENPLNLICPITQVDFNQEDQVTQIIHCKHLFCTNAIMQWFDSHVHCPLCRHDIRETGENRETTEENREENRENRETGENGASDQYTFDIVFR